MSEAAVCSELKMQVVKMEIAKPKMIMFDFGETILKSERTDFLKGTQSVLELSENPNGVTAEEIQGLTDRLTQEIYGFRERQFLEHSCQSFQRYIFEYYGVRLTRPADELERIFWNSAFAWVPTEGILDLLRYLDKEGIRKGIISNISFTGDIIRYELKKHMPDISFDFIIASVDYCFRKPSPHLFELALKKAGLSCGEVWYAGDRHEYDVKGAEACNLYPVWYDSCGCENRLSCGTNLLKIADWGELIEVLEKLPAEIAEKSLDRAKPVV